MRREGEKSVYLGVEADLDSRLDLVFTLDQQVQQLLCVDRCLTVVGHQPNETCVPAGAEGER